MSWLNKYRRGLRFAFVGLLLVAIVGPWAYDRINVPAEYPCQLPNIRLEGDFCGLPLSGLWIISSVGFQLAYSIGGLFTGMTANTSVGLISLMLAFLISIILPFLSTFLISWHEDEHRRQIFHIAAWCLATTAAIYLFFSLNTRIYWALWGNLLYVILAVGALVIEISVLAAGKTPARNLVI